MELIKPSYKIHTPLYGEQILQDIELAARNCYKSEGKIELQAARLGWEPPIAKSARVLIRKLIERGHHAMLEFGGSITVSMICDRGVSHELVRHRIASFAQESTRYCNYGSGDVVFVIPPWLNLRPQTIKVDLPWIESAEEIVEDLYTPEADWMLDMARAERAYQCKILGINPRTNKPDARVRKWSPQEARGVLPNALKTEIFISANIREWRHIFSQRTAPGAHPQMREIMRPLLKEFSQQIPVLFDDLVASYD